MSDTASRLYLSLRSHGSVLTVSGDQVVIRGPELTDVMRERIRAEKPALLDLLQKISAGEMSPERDRLRDWLDDGSIARIPLPFQADSSRTIIDVDRCIRSWLRDAATGQGQLREAAIGHVLALYRALSPLIASAEEEESSAEHR